MATRAKKKSPSSATGAAPGADDLEVLNPNGQITVAGQKLIVREYGFIEGLRLESKIKPFVDDLHAEVAHQGVPPLEDIVVVLGLHADLIEELIATSCDVEQSFVHGLNDQEGRRLMFCWWHVCGPFFMTRVFDRIRAAKAAAAVAAGATSTPS